MFETAGHAAEEIAELTIGLFVLGTAVFVFVLLMLAVALRRRGAEIPEGLPHPSGISANAPRLLVFGGGVVLPVVVIIGVFAWTIETMRDIPGAAPDDALTINVTGHQWWWELEYPDEGIELADELHLPTDRAVELRIESSDVIHSFWVPSLGGKMDAIPSRTNVLVVSANRTGVFDGRCAEFCGLDHTLMELKVTIHTPEDFDRWVDEQHTEAEIADD